MDPRLKRFGSQSLKSSHRMTKPTQNSGLRTQRAFFLSFAFCILSCASLGGYTPGRFYHTGKSTDKVIALTFDDGPGRFTVPILELLKRHNIKATFFMEGIMVETYPEIARQVLQEGHEI